MILSRTSLRAPLSTRFRREVVSLLFFEKAEVLGHLGVYGLVNEKEGHGGDFARGLSFGGSNEFAVGKSEVARIECRANELRFVRGVLEKAGRHGDGIKRLEYLQ